MKITKKVLKEMIEEILAEGPFDDIDVSNLLSPEQRKKLEKIGPAVGLPAAATAVDIAKKVASDAMKAGKDAAEAVKAIATAKPKTADEVAKIMSKMPANKSMSMARTGDPDLFVGMQTTGPNLPGGKKARKKIRKRKCPKLPLRIGCQGPLVKEIQKLLIYVGFGRQLGPAGADGDYGNGTFKAVKAFQKDEGNLEVDGVAGKNTVKALKDLAKDMRKDIKSGQPAALATDASLGKAKKDTRVDTPIVGGAPEMSRVEALRATRDDMVPVSYTKRYRRPSNVRSLAIKAIKYLMDDAGVAPGQAYRDLIEVFGLGGARYFDPALLKRTALVQTAKGKKLKAAVQKFVTNLENVIGIELDEL